MDEARGERCYLRICMQDEHETKFEDEFVSVMTRSWYIDGMKPELTSAQQQALIENDGFVRGSSYVLMSIDVFRRTCGIEDEEQERREALLAIDEAVEQFEAGKGIPLSEFEQRLNEQHGLRD